MDLEKRVEELEAQVADSNQAILALLSMFAFEEEKDPLELFHEGNKVRAARVKR